MKRGIKISLFVIVFIIGILILNSFVITQEATNVPAENVPAETTPTDAAAPTGNVEASSDADAVDNTDGASDVELDNDEELDEAVVEDESEEENEILEEIENEHADVEETSAGITPDSAFYFIESGIFEKFRNDIANMRKKMAEIRKLIQENKIEEAKISLEKLKEYARQVEAEADPEMRDEVRRAVAEILQTIKRIEDRIPEAYKKEFVDDVLVVSENVATAAEISTKINELCNQLIDLGEFEKANEVCNLDSEEKETPSWLKRKRNEWKQEMSEEAENFFDVLKECMEVTSDDIQGNYDQCRCDEMPSAQQELCYEIAKTEDEGGDASSLIEQFMKGLPNDLKVAVERSMSEFEEEGFERNRPEECQDVDSFERCQELMFRRSAPGPCLNALDRGEIEPTKEACEKIMFAEHAPSECKGLSSDECAELFEGDFEKESFRDRGPGFDVSAVCNNIKDSQSRLDCYDSNVEKARGLGNYHDERNKFRDEFSDDFSGTFDEHKEEFEKKFSEKYNDKYKQEQELIRASDARFRKTQDYQEQFAAWCIGKGGRWDCSFASASPESPCRCFGSDKKEPQYDYDFDKYFSEEHREEFQTEGELDSSPPKRFRSPPEGQPPEGFRSSPEGGFENFQPPEGFQPPKGEFRPPQEGFKPSSGEEFHQEGQIPSGSEGSGSSSSGSSGGGEGGGGLTGGFTGRSILDNEFLEYYFG